MTKLTKNAYQENDEAHNKEMTKLTIRRQWNSPKAHNKELIKLPTKKWKSSPICIAQQGSNEAHKEHTIKSRQTTKFNKQSQITNQSIILITSNKISTKTKNLFSFLKEGSVRRKLSQQLLGGTSSNKLFFFLLNLAWKLLLTRVFFVAKSSRICRIKCWFVIQKTLSMGTQRWALGCISSRKLGPLPRPSKSGATWLMKIV